MSDEPTVSATAGPPDLPMAQPIARAERIDVLDVIRGFALIGILLMNIEWFSRPIVELALGLDPALQGADRGAAWFIFTFVQGKFYTLFSLLFGMGFVVFLVRAEKAGRIAGRLFARRLTILLLIGVAHGVLLWAGDILATYALVGFALLLFRRSSAKKLMTASVVMFMLMLLMMPLMQVGLAFDREARALATNEAALAKLDADTRSSIVEHAKSDPPEVEVRRQAAESAEVYRTGSYAQVTVIRATEFMHQLQYVVFAGISVLSMFLLGAWFVRAGVIHDPERHAPLFRRMMIVGLLLGIPLALLAANLIGSGSMFDMGWRGTAGMSLMFLVNLMLCLGYVGTLVTLWLAPGTRRFVAIFAPAGRMALSNYLGHSLVFSTLFYGYGGGWFGQVSRSEQVGLALGLIAVQILVSIWWLNRYRYGPMEWVWRSATYGKLQPMRL